MDPYCFDPYFRVFKNEPILHKPIFFTILKNGPIFLNPYFVILWLRYCFTRLMRNYIQLMTISKISLSNDLDPQKRHKLFQPIFLFFQKWTHIVSTHIFVFSKMDPYCIDPYFSNFQKYTHILGPIFFIWVHTFEPIFLIWV